MSCCLYCCIADLFSPQLSEDKSIQCWGRDSSPMQRPCRWRGSTYLFGPLAQMMLVHPYAVMLLTWRTEKMLVLISPGVDAA